MRCICEELDTATIYVAFGTDLATDGLTRTSGDAAGSVHRTIARDLHLPVKQFAKACGDPLILLHIESALGVAQEFGADPTPALELEIRSGQ